MFSQDKEKELVWIMPIDIKENIGRCKGDFFQ